MLRNLSSGTTIHLATKCLNLAGLECPASTRTGQIDIIILG